MGVSQYTESVWTGRRDLVIAAVFLVASFFVGLVVKTVRDHQPEIPPEVQSPNLIESKPFDL